MGQESKWCRVSGLFQCALAEAFELRLVVYQIRKERTANDIEKHIPVIVLHLTAVVTRAVGSRLMSSRSRLKFVSFYLSRVKEQQD